VFLLANLLRSPKPGAKLDSMEIINSDCLDVLPNLPPAQLFFCDPPYNVGKD
jgi:site-specific DNA-adenine methylase